MDKETLSNYGWIVICILVMMVMIALATPFGQFIADAINATKDGLYDANQNALHSTGLIKDNTIIPEGGTYYVGVTTSNVGDYTGATEVYTAGQKFPEVVNRGDIYVYEDYEYRYGYAFLGTWFNAQSQATIDMLGGIGWGVHVLDMGKQSYSKMLDTIAEKPVTCLAFTFAECRALNVAPYVSQNTTTMLCMMKDCDALVDASGIVIPSTTISTKEMFYGCDLLKIAPDFSKATGMQTINYMFGACQNLEVAPNLMNCNNLTDMAQAFKRCTNLKTYHGSTDADGNFANYIIPSNVTNKSDAFLDCSQITQLPL